MSSILKQLRTAARLNSPLWRAVPVQATAAFDLAPSESVGRQEMERTWDRFFDSSPEVTPPLPVAFYEGEFLKDDSGTMRAGFLVVPKKADQVKARSLPAGTDSVVLIWSWWQPQGHGLLLGADPNNLEVVSSSTIGICLGVDRRPLPARGYRYHGGLTFGLSYLPNAVLELGFGPVFATVNLIHALFSARNVALVRRESRASKKGKPSGSYRGIVWHEIVVTKKPLAEGSSKIVARADVDHVLKREHLARGHFKDYTKGAGLFGKYTGRFWWSPHVRGSRDEGTVMKEYRLEAESEVVN